jgi:hypothetical protein
MRLQNKRFIERHLEKALIGAAVVFLAGVCWYFFMGGLDLSHPGDPVRIAVDEHQPDDTIGVQELEAQIADKLNGLNRLLEKPNPKIDDRKVPDYARDLRIALDTPLSPAEQLATFFNAPGTPITPPPRDTHYDLAEVPAPEDLRALANFGVLAEVNNAPQMQEFIKVIGTQVPRDFPYGSVSAVFDRVKMLKAMREVTHKIPEDALMRTLYFADIRLERQMQDPMTRQWGATGADGKFRAGDNALDVIPLPPGTPDFRDPAAAANPTAALNAMAEPGAQEKIYQQPFPPLAPDRPFRAPETLGLSADKAAEYVKLEAELIQVRQSLSNADAAPAPPMPNPGGPGGIGRGPLSPPPTDKKAALVAREQVLVAQMAALVGAPPAMALENLPADVSPIVRIRAHDLTVKPGTTYRYRIAVSVGNPLYQRSGLTKEQHAEYFNRLALTSKPSAWSEPVTTEPEYRLFAQLQPNSLLSRTVNFQAWRVVGGRWTRGDFPKPFSPGEDVVDSVTFSAGGVKTPPYVVRYGAILVDLAGTNAGNARVILMHADGRLEEINVAAEQKRLDEIIKAEGQKTAMTP